jgi:hypothetical protein
MTTRGYQFHGLNVTITGDEVVQAALDARLGQFPQGRLEGRPDLRFDFVKTAGSRGADRPDGAGRSILEVGAGEVLYFDDLDQLYIEFADCGRSLCDIQGRHATVWYAEAAEEDGWVLSHPFFTIALTEMLKREGLHMMHAAGLTVGRKGLLVAGESGCGKTTLTLMLVRAGFGFMADDTVFLSAPAPGGISRGLRALAFPDEAGVTEETTNFFPELRTLPGKPQPRRRNKKPLGLAEVYGVKPCWECEPAALVFPQPSVSDRSVIAPMPASEALMRLVCNVLRTEPRSSQAHLDALAALVKGTRCYSLQTGRDFEELAPALRSLVEREF